MSRQAPESGLSRPLKPWAQLAISFLVLSVLLSISAISGQAQVLYGSLTGNVTDATGAVVAGAQIEALNVATGVKRTETSNTEGVYRFVALQAGIYKVTISAKGFETYVVNELRVDQNNIRRVDAALKVAQRAENVEVTAATIPLQTDKADVHTDLTTNEIANMPAGSSQGRNFQALLRIIPGVGLTAETNSESGNPQRAINANVNGQSNQTNNTRLDGAQDAYPYLPANVAYVPPADAIEFVNVVTNSFDAEQGMAGGAAVNVAIKSGTNAYHGSAHEFHTDHLLASRNYFQTDLTRFPKRKNKNIQNQFGGQLGGPIFTDKLFFFADWERTTQRKLAGPQTRTLPTSQMAQGDFRGLPGNIIIYDPLTGNNTGAGKQQISCGGVLNVICADRIDPASQKMVELLQASLAKVQPTANGLNNFSDSGTASFTRDNVDVKVNYVPTSKSTLFGRYSFSKSNIFDPPLLGDAVGDATGGGQLGTSPGLIQSVGLGATYTFTPTVLLDWNFGFTRQRLGSTFDLTEAKGLDLLGIPGTNNANSPGDPTMYYGLPAFQIGLNPGQTNQIGFSMGNTNTGNPFLFRDNQFVTGANLSWTHGKHFFRGGIELNHTQVNHFQPQGGTLQTPRGTLQFNGNATADRGGVQGPSWFTAWADFLLGLPSATGKSAQLFNPTALRWSQYAWYLRDQWQVTPKLTLNIGVRWEYYPFGYSDNNRGLRWLDLSNGNVMVGGYGSTPKDDGIKTGSGQFLPRIGLAYRLTNSTVLRAGFGQSADPNNWRKFRDAYPSVLLSTNTVAVGSNFIPVASLTGRNGSGLGGGSYSVPTGIQLLPLPDLSSGVVALPTGASTTTIDNPYRRGYINSFNLMLQHEWKGFVAETGYVGARAIRPMVNMNANASLPGTGQPGGLLSVAAGRVFSGNINVVRPFKNNYYDSLQTKITRRFKQGTTAGFVWTWSKAIDYQGNEDLSALRFPHPDYWWKDRGVADFDRTHNVKIYGTFILPFGKGQQWAESGLASKILGGWQLSPIVSIMTGLPFTVNANAGPLSANGSQQTADLVSKFTINNGQPPRTGVSCAPNDASCRYFDPSAFSAPYICTDPTPGACPNGISPAHYGNTDRNAFRGPGYFQMDASLARELRLTERFRLQLRAEAFSLTNTPHFANPNTTCGAAAGQVCSTSANNFGVITGTLQPGGFFGPDPGTRSVWFGARLMFKPPLPHAGASNLARPPTYHLESWTVTRFLRHP